jgi:hypothetical protein
MDKNTAAVLGTMPAMGEMAGGSWEMLDRPALRICKQNFQNVSVEYNPQRLKKRTWRSEWRLDF